MDTYEKKYKEIVGKIRKAYLYAQTDSTKAVLKEIFPELAESEDEKVRKALLELVHDTTGDELWVDYNVHKEEALDWLEKQGEHANFRNKIQVGDKVTRNEDGYLVNLSQLNRVAKAEERQGEQNFEMKSAEESLGVDSDTYNKIVDECIFGEQKPEENKGNIVGISSNWSEKDNWYVEDIISLLDFGGSIHTKEQIQDWLRSLQDRVQPQNKWKPSSEQIGLLQAIINEPNNAASESCQIVLREVLEQLKKLKEE